MNKKYTICFLSSDVDCQFRVKSYGEHPSLCKLKEKAKHLACKHSWECEETTPPEYIQIPENNDTEGQEGGEHND